MGTLSRWVGIGTAAALLATSMPAMARPRYGYHSPAFGNGYGHYGRRYHRNRFDFGDFLLGAVIAGGVVAAVSSARDRDRRPREDRADSRAFDHDQEAAADACASAVERQASRNSDDARVTDVDRVNRDGEGWRVEGVVATGDERSYGDTRRFQCGVRYGQVDFVQLGDELAVR